MFLWPFTSKWLKNTEISKTGEKAQKYENHQKMADNA